MIKSQKQQAVFAGLLTATVLIGWSSLFTTFALGWHNDEYTYILLILPLAIALFLFERSTADVNREWDLRVGLPLLLATVVITVITQLLSSRITADLQLTMGMLAIVLSWIGSFVLCFGHRTARRLLFPLLFLLGMVPLPAAVMNYIVVLLQVGSAWFAHALFEAFGVPVFQQGVLLTIPTLTIQVAKECSSIRSSSMLLVVTIVSARVLLRSPLSRILVIALAILLSVAKNGFRVFTIAMLGTKVDRGYLTGSLHRQGGILFFMAALVGVFAAIGIFRTRENLQARWSS